MDNLDERTPLFPSAPRRWLIPTLAAMTALSIGGYLSLHSTGKQTMALPGESHLSPSPDAPKPGPQGDNQPVDAQVTKPTRRELVYTVTLPANISPLYQTTLYAKVSGYLKWIGPDKGDSVKKDQILAIIDAPEVDEQFHQALSDYHIKKLTFERLAKVWKESPDVIAKQDVDVVEAAAQGAKHLAEQRMALRDYTKVRAPYTGVITARFADPGALIQIATASSAGAIPLFTIMDLDTVRVYTNVSQDDSSWVVPGKTKATVIVKGLDRRSFTGTVTRSTLALDPSTRSLLVEIDLPNKDHALRPGTYVEVSLGLREIPNALVLPPQAIISGPKGKSVFIVEGGRAKSVPVQTGISDGRWMEVTDGLSGDEQVVVVGKRRLVEGAHVTPAPFNLPDVKPAQQKFERRSPGSNQGVPPASANK
ncbi:MAG: efflux RND transporter periplasmic adaptor subunit [Nitrospiraceae bacterium]|nr:efflux RND transporter periplasmic adaptor subunit [Nitrospira sp.]MDW7648017.1 efflux RND transporter periplasmic adaptor subunit [Nitrospiraceae bacterium]GBL40505.1 efflux pump periplasmic linker BepF [Nitrospirota bacterium]MBP0121410.1 efflux RND transporter periplasmic adaptor subunit [Nitrospira sp.]MBP0125024.1 efflux RND transporter periplasmic adaptor subunit [Nitrospira sp.]